MNEDLLMQAIIDHLPQDEGIVMTVAQQLEKRGMERGIEQGRAEGKAEAMRQMAKKQLAHGLAPQTVSQWTGLSIEQLKQLAEEI